MHVYIQSARKGCCINIQCVCVGGTGDVGVLIFHVIIKLLVNVAVLT